MATEKVSVSLDRELLTEARERARGKSSLSAYLNDALAIKLSHERMGEFLDYLDDLYGPLTQEEIEEGERWWDDVQASFQQ